MESARNVSVQLKRSASGFTMGLLAGSALGYLPSTKTRKTLQFFIVVFLPLVWFPEWRRSENQASFGKEREVKAIFCKR